MKSQSDKMRDLKGLPPKKDRPPKQTHGDVISAWLKRHNKTVERLSLETGLNIAYLRSVIGGRTAITHSTAHRLQRVLGIPARDWLRARS